VVYAENLSRDFACLSHGQACEEELSGKVSSGLYHASLIATRIVERGRANLFSQHTIDGR
jgi:hypothetical protein